MPQALGLVIGSYILICLFVYVRQGGMVFHPSRDLEATPADAGLAYEDLEPRSADGTMIHAWFIPGPEGAKRVALFCHGNGGNISHRLDTFRINHELGLATLIFDYRGYGRSEGQPSEEGLYADAEAAFQHLLSRGYAEEDVVVWGRSLGGGVASWIASRHKVAALIMESTFTSITDMGARSYPWLPVRLLSRFRFPSLSRMSGLRCPVLVIHSREDKVVPWDMGQKLHAASPEPKAFVEIHGPHNDGFLQSRDKYMEGLRGFLGSL